ncbi:hypothetical protein B6U90_01315 [Thermoplasmatales archaeon ex4484_6]|nr:MAG: hypothetical protein B6U90_01315 [Thermoplasmatales archaeon ex4484_6]
MIDHEGRGFLNVWIGMGPSKTHPFYILNRRNTSDIFVGRQHRPDIRDRIFLNTCDQLMGEMTSPDNFLINNAFIHLFYNIGKIKIEISAYIFCTMYASSFSPIESREIVLLITHSILSS